MTKPYWQKLQDPRWQRKRLEILNLAQFKCEDCKDDDETLTVHHSYYEKGKEPWEYPDESLHCLCSGCHEARADSERQLLAVCHRLNAGELLDLAEGISHANGMKMSGREIQRAVTNAATHIRDAMLSNHERITA